MPDRLDREIDVEGRPVQMIRGGAFDSLKLSESCLAEPGKVHKRDKELLLSQPEGKTIC